MNQNCYWHSQCLIIRLIDSQFQKFTSGSMFYLANKFMHLLCPCIAMCVCSKCYKIRVSVGHSSQSFIRTNKTLDEFIFFFFRCWLSLFVSLVLRDSINFGQRQWLVKNFSTIEIYGFSSPDFIYMVRNLSKFLV